MKYSAMGVCRHVHHTIPWSFRDRVVRTGMDGQLYGVEIKSQSKLNRILKGCAISIFFRGLEIEIL